MRCAGNVFKGNVHEMKDVKYVNAKYRFSIMFPRWGYVFPSRSPVNQRGRSALFEPDAVKSFTKLESGPESGKMAKAAHKGRQDGNSE